MKARFLSMSSRSLGVSCPQSMVTKGAVAEGVDFLEAVGAIRRAVADDGGAAFETALGEGILEVKA